MDNRSFYYFQRRNQENQAEIFKELVTTRHLLNEAGSNAAATNKMKRMVLRTVPATIIMTLILLYFLG